MTANPAMAEDVPAAKMAAYTVLVQLAISGNATSVCPEPTTQVAPSTMMARGPALLRMLVKLYIFM